METKIDFAMLAPVPLEHLDAGLEVCEREGYVAYGSMKWELFREIDRLRDGEPVPVLIYPSYEHDAAGLHFEIRWTGLYIGHVRSLGGVHPDKMKYRPATAMNYANDISGSWAIYWHVSRLTKLPDGQGRSISSLKSYKSGKYWRAGSPPRGPEIVARPSWI